jgi:hypothetical protein|tara:strand:+ start:1007 stop:1660 length:654 start_codon:yes stop_codon:yes gene_type:complete
MSLNIQDGIVTEITGLTINSKQVKQIEKLVTPSDVINNRYRVLNMFPQGATQFGVNPVVVDHFKVSITSVELSRVGFRIFMDGTSIKLEVNNPIGLSQVLFDYTLASGASGSFAINNGVTITLGAGTTGENVIISNLRYRNTLTNAVIDPNLPDVTLVVDNISPNPLVGNFTPVIDVIAGYSLTGTNIDAYIDTYGNITHNQTLLQNYIVTIQFTEL